MKESDFLKKAANSGQLEVADPSENIFDSYTKRSDDCLRAADLLIKTLNSPDILAVGYDFF